MISVIIPAWITREETLELTKATIQSLGDVELVIVDNGSTIGGGWMRSVADVYIRNRENKGYAIAVNQGLRLATCRLKTIANNDIRVSPNWQVVAEEVLHANTNAYSCHFRMIGYDEPMEYGDTIAYTGKERWCHGSFYIIDTQKVTFYYDEAYFNSYDDWDLFNTVRKSGLYTAYTDKACFQHANSHTQQLIPERGANDKKNKEYFKSKWGYYPDEGFAREFPEQMKKDYWKGFQL